MGLPFPGPDFFELLPAYQTLLPDTWFFSFLLIVGLLWLATLGTTLGTHPHRCTPIDSWWDASRCSHSHSRHRYSHSRTTHRHSRWRYCNRDRPHGLWGSSTGCKVTEYLCKTWMNITQCTKTAWLWCHRTPCRASLSSPKGSRGACPWVQDKRLRWWQNRWLPMVIRRTDQPINRRWDACSGCFSSEMR